MLADNFPSHCSGWPSGRGPMGWPQSRSSTHGCFAYHLASSLPSSELDQGKDPSVVLAASVLWLSRSPPFGRWTTAVHDDHGAAATGAISVPALRFPASRTRMTCGVQR